MNWGILGHEWAVSLLKEHIVQGRLRHAYLIIGPEGVGRRTLAVHLAQAVNCSNPPSPGEPCGVCRACLQIGRMQHPDLAVVQGEGKSGTIKVDQIRELQRGLSLAPYEAHYRVAILKRFEQSQPSAANALLKTLEEPPPQVLLAVTAESAESLLPTIVSRCEVLRLRPLPLEDVVQGLQTRWGLPPERALLLAHLSSGRPGFALRLHQEPEWMEQRQMLLEDHQKLLASSLVERFAYAKSLTDEKEKDSLRNALQIWLSLWRDALLSTAGAAAPLVNVDKADQIQELAGRISLDQAGVIISSLEHTLDLIDRNVNARLAAEVLMLDLPRL